MQGTTRFKECCGPYTAYAAPSALAVGILVGVVALATQRYWTRPTPLSSASLSGRVTPPPPIVGAPPQSIPALVPPPSTPATTGLQETVTTRGPRPAAMPPAPLFTDTMLAGCRPDPRTILDQIDWQIASRVPSNKLYTLNTPDGVMRFRVIVRFDGRMQISYRQSPAGVCLCHDGPNTALKTAFREALDGVAKKHGLSLRMELSELLNGQNPVDACANY